MWQNIVFSQRISSEFFCFLHKTKNHLRVTRAHFSLSFFMLSLVAVFIEQISCHWHSQSDNWHYALVKTCWDFYPLLSLSLSLNFVAQLLFPFFFLFLLLWQNKFVNIGQKWKEKFSYNMSKHNAKQTNTKYKSMLHIFNRCVANWCHFTSSIYYSSLQFFLRHFFFSYFVLAWGLPKCANWSEQKKLKMEWNITWIWKGIDWKRFSFLNWVCCMFWCNFVTFPNSFCLSRFFFFHFQPRLNAFP